jgi:anti-sigma regulatory factor (Ser/Thr protein kinase)
MATDARNRRVFDAPTEGTRRESGARRASISRASFTPHLPDALSIKSLARPTVVGQVRMMIGFRLVAWGYLPGRFVELSDNLQLIASELLTNAIDETPDHTIHIECALDIQLQAIRFAVWDSSRAMPYAHMPELIPESLDLSPDEADKNGGWGLPLVQVLADDCGVTRTEHGKWVWAILDVRKPGTPSRRLGK